MGGGERLLERVRPGVLHADLAACCAYAQGLDSAATVTCPTAVIMGAEDRMTPARAGAKLTAAIPGAKAIVIPACGHMMLAEKPDETLDALKRSEEHTSELQSLMRNSYAVFCLKTKNN